MSIEPNVNTKTTYFSPQQPSRAAEETGSPERTAEKKSGWLGTITGILSFGWLGSGAESKQRIAGRMYTDSQTKTSLETAAESVATRVLGILTEDSVKGMTTEALLSYTVNDTSTEGDIVLHELARRAKYDFFFEGDISTSEEAKKAYAFLRRVNAAIQFLAENGLPRDVVTYHDMSSEIDLKKTIEKLTYSETFWKIKDIFNYAKDDRWCSVFESIFRSPSFPAHLRTVVLANILDDRETAHKLYWHSRLLCQPQFDLLCDLITPEMNVHKKDLSSLLLEAIFQKQSRLICLLDKYGVSFEPVIDKIRIDGMTTILTTDVMMTQGTLQKLVLGVDSGAASILLHAIAQKARQDFYFRKEIDTEEGRKEALHYLEALILILRHKTIHCSLQTVSDVKKEIDRLRDKDWGQRLIDVEFSFEDEGQKSFPLLFHCLSTDQDPRGLGNCLDKFCEKLHRANKWICREESKATQLNTISEYLLTHDLIPQDRKEWPCCIMPFSHD